VTSNKRDGSQGAIPANSSNVQCNKSNADISKPAKPENLSSIEGIDLQEAVEKDQEEATAEVLIFPNPSTGKIFLQYPGSQESGTTVAVYDSYGKQCRINTAKAADNVLEIDLSGESPGMYLIRIDRENAVQVSKVIIH
jgi:hypothetical protein